MLLSLRYGLVGKNGVGKSTLLRRMALCAIPGFPRHLRVYLVEQETSEQRFPSALAYIVHELRAWCDGDLPPVSSSGVGVASLLEALQQEHARVEEAVDAAAAAAGGGGGGGGGGAGGSDDSGDGDDDDVDMDALVERLQDIEDRIRQLEAVRSSGGGVEVVEEDDGSDAGGDVDPAFRRAVQSLLREMGFSKALRTAPTHTLSGGWRTRLALAVGLMLRPDVLLLDEPTNNLDLEGAFAVPRCASRCAASLGCRVLFTVVRSLRVLPVPCVSLGSRVSLFSLVEPGSVRLRAGCNAVHRGCRVCVHAGVLWMQSFLGGAGLAKYDIETVIVVSHDRYGYTSVIAIIVVVVVVDVNACFL
jgi:energy-coupling factor transporter ATP-binding protein EcfA2